MVVKSGCITINVLKPLNGILAMVYKSYLNTTARTMGGGPPIPVPSHQEHYLEAASVNQVLEFILGISSMHITYHLFLYPPPFSFFFTQMAVYFISVLCLVFSLHLFWSSFILTASLSFSLLF